jgi:hypothetical protein
MIYSKLIEEERPSATLGALEAIKREVMELY